MTPISLDFPCSPEKFQAIRMNFAEHDVLVPDEASGFLQHHGVGVRFTYDGITLRLSIVSKPIWVTDRRVTDGLTEFIQAS